MAILKLVITVILMVSGFELLGGVSLGMMENQIMKGRQLGISENNSDFVFTTKNRIILVLEDYEFYSIDRESGNVVNQDSLTQRDFYFVDDHEGGFLIVDPVGDETRRIKRYDEDLNLISEYSAKYKMSSVAVDNGFIYYLIKDSRNETDSKIEKRRLADYSLVATSEKFWSTSVAQSGHDTFIDDEFYYLIDGRRRIVKVRKSNLEIASASNEVFSNSGLVRMIGFKDYFYLNRGGRTGTSYNKRYRKSDLSDSMMQSELMCVNATRKNIYCYANTSLFLGGKGHLGVVAADEDYNIIRESPNLNSSSFISKPDLILDNYGRHEMPTFYTIDNDKIINEFVDFGGAI